MELTCYVYDGWRPRIRPASSKRDWMEATTERFAYRCLPLAIANSHGWELLSPCGFEARWTGGSGAEAVEIRLDPGTDPKHVPVSLFGQATITFHVEGLFRTPEGWNLWVGGSPNAAKDGIAPLGGVIETDWSPYSFTMNWRFTRANHWVRFEENEPICFFFPVERKALLGVEPRILPIELEPDLKTAFETWSKSRDAFQKWVHETKPTAPADRWQKLYYRGVAPDGTDGAADHQSKLRPRPFRLPDGSEMVPPEAKACPVHVAPPRAPKPPAASILAAPAKPSLLNPQSGPVPDAVMRMTLSQIGFNPSGTAPRLTIEAPRVAPQPPRRPDAPAELVAQRRDWLLAAREAQQALGSIQGVPRVRNISSEAFLEHFYAPSRPVVIEGAMAGWPALERWTPDYLRRTVGAAPITFQGGREGSPDFELYKDNHARELPFDRFIDLITADGAGNDAYLTAYNSSRNQAALAPLEADLGHLDAFLTPGPGMMWIGPGGTFTPLHFDLTNNLLAQVTGRKTVTLVPPSETRFLYHRRHVFSDVHDITDEGCLARHPLARQARRSEVTMGPGDLLYIPVGWWHQVRATEFSVMLTYTNFLWPNVAFEGFPPD